MTSTIGGRAEVVCPVLTTPPASDPGPAGRAGRRQLQTARRVGTDPNRGSRTRADATWRPQRGGWSMSNGANAGHYGGGAREARLEPDPRGGIPGRHPQLLSVLTHLAVSNAAALVPRAAPSASSWGQSPGRGRYRRCTTISEAMDDEHDEHDGRRDDARGRPGIGELRAPGRVGRRRDDFPVASAERVNARGRRRRPTPVSLPAPAPSNGMVR